MPPKPKYISENAELPDTARAAHIGMLVLRATGCNSWEVLTASPDSWRRVVLSERQQELIDEYFYLLPYLRLSPTQTVVYCETCDLFRLVAKNPGKSSKCEMREGCPGTPVFVSKLPKRKAPGGGVK